MFGATSLALAVSLSMDSFAAALGRGAVRSRPAVPDALLVGASFGACQLLMSVIGWSIGSAFAGAVQAVDHWIAFALLILIGGSMVRNALGGEEGGGVAGDPTGTNRRTTALALVATAVATSIDASAVGVGLAMADIDIATTATLVGLVTFAMAFGGVLLGRAVGPLLGRRAEFVGGLGLVAIGAKILLEHLLA
jgi:putative Mn2+ efflux pump MntP